MRRGITSPIPVLAAGCFHAALRRKQYGSSRATVLFTYGLKYFVSAAARATRCAPLTPPSASPNDALPALPRMAGPLSPDVLEPSRGQSCVAHGRLDRPVAHKALQGPGIDPAVRQLIPAGMTQHVGVNLERQASLPAGPLHQPVEPRHGDAARRKPRPITCATLRFGTNGMTKRLVRANRSIH
jgi:hypothetical protein